MQAESQPMLASKVSYPLTYSVLIQNSSNLKKDSPASSTHAILQDNSDLTGHKYTVFEEGRPLKSNSWPIL